MARRRGVLRHFRVRDPTVAMAIRVPDSSFLAILRPAPDPARACLPGKHCACDCPLGDRKPRSWICGGDATVLTLPDRIPPFLSRAADRRTLAATRLLESRLRIRVLHRVRVA